MKRELREVRDRDIQGMAVYSSDGQFVGAVNCQVSEPVVYTHRYLVVQQDSERLAIPADAIADISPSGVVLSLPARLLASLPPYDEKMGRAFELRVHFALNRTPYWEIDVNE
ncbi:MAG: hypothetical protein GX766_05720 [Firmicutes bacterium]|nr:hypothetical protein [Bacillota bacterium]HQD38980.1 hypothetical protein [Bacillota bacterium]